MPLESTTLPESWLNMDIGNVGVEGSVDYTTQSFTVHASGVDIWDKSDSFHYATRSLLGKGEIIARVTAVENTYSWAKAGLMIRESLAPNSRHASIFLTPGNGVAYQCRKSTGGSSVSTSGGSASAPTWLKLVRDGSTLRGYRSSNGTSWTLVKSDTVSMTSMVYVGLAVTSHNNQTLNTSIFDNVRLNGTFTPALSTVSVSPVSVTGGKTAMGEVVLDAAAPSGGAAVRLSSNSSFVTVPSSVTVFARETRRTFTVKTKSVTAPVTATITATYGSSIKTVSLTLMPAGGVSSSLSSVSVNPTSVASNGTAQGTVTLTSAAPSGGAVVGLSSSNALAATVPASVTIPAGSTNAIFMVTARSVSTSTPVTISGVYAGVTRTASLTVQPAPAAASLSSVSLNPTTVASNGTSQGRVTLTSAAPSGGAVVTLSSSNTSAATVPASVTVPAGSTSATFTVSARSVSAATSVTISAAYNGVTKTAALTVQPPPTSATLSSLSLNPTSVASNGTSQGTVTLTAAAPSGGAVVTLSSTNTSVATVPASVTIAGGATSANFTVTAQTVSALTSVSISAAYNGVTKTAVLTVQPPSPAVTLSSLSLNPASVTGGGSSQGTVTLNGAAPSGGAVVQLSSTNPSVASVPASVTVSAGTTSKTFQVTTNAVSSTTSVTISGSYGGVSRGMGLSVQAASAPPPIPSLTLSTYVRGSSAEESVRDVAVDANGFIYVAGGTESSTFVTTSGAYDRTFNGVHDVWVRKFAPDGSLVWSTFIGGSNYDRAYAIEVDATGVYIAGRAGSGFPTTSGVVQPSFAGDSAPNSQYGTQDGFVTKLSLDGQRVIWSTYAGTSSSDIVRDIAIDSSGNVYLAITGTPVTSTYLVKNSFDVSHGGNKDGIVCKLNSTGTQVVWGAFVGGSANDGGTPAIRVHSDGTVYYLVGVSSTSMFTSSGAGQRSFAGGPADLYLVKIAANGASRLFATYYGGNGNEWIETHTLALDPAGNAFVAGTTMSTNLPGMAGGFQSSYQGSGGSGTGANTNYAGDGFVAKVSGSNGSFIQATYIGGNVGDGLQGIDTDSSGNVVVSGATFSASFPMSPDAIQPVKSSSADTWVAKLSADLSQLMFSTFMGGSRDEELRALDVDGNGTIYSAGSTTSSNFPTTSNAFEVNHAGGWDGVLVRIEMNGAQAALPPPPPASNIPPVAQVSASPLSGNAPLTVQFTAIASDADGQIASYAWNFGDGGVSNAASPSHTYQSAGQYSATLTVTDDEGATDSASIIITVSSATPPPPPPPTSSACDFYVSPNGSRTGAGTAADPWHVETATNSPAITPGSTVCFTTGRYNKANLNFSRNGLPGSPITYMSAPGHWAEFDMYTTDVLAVSIFDSTSRVVVLADGTGFYNGSEVLIDNEIIRLNGKQPDGVTYNNVVRGSGGTTPVSHVAGASAKLAITAVRVTGNYQIHLDYQVLSTNPERVVTWKGSAHAGRLGELRNDGFNAELINLVVTDTAGVTNQAGKNGRIYGLTILTPGWAGPADDRGHGHGIYAQTSGLDDLVTVQESVILNSFGHAIKFFASDDAPGSYPSEHIVIDGVIGAGSATGWAMIHGLDAYHSNFAINSGVAVKSASITNSFSWHRPGANGRGFELGAGVANKMLVATGNYIGGGIVGVTALSWENFTFLDNTIFTPDRITLGGSVTTASTFLGSALSGVWDRTRMFDTATSRSDKHFIAAQAPCAGGDCTYSNWKLSTGFEANGSYFRALPPDATYLRPNIHERGRANLIVFNYSLSATKTVNFSSLGYSNGDRVRIYNLQNWPSYQEFVYDSSNPARSTAVPVVVNDLTVRQPFGWGSNPAITSMAPVFNVFSIQKCPCRPYRAN